MLRCNNPKCGHEDEVKTKPHICPECGWIMVENHAKSLPKRMKIYAEDIDGDK